METKTMYSRELLSVEISTKNFLKKAMQAIRLYRDTDEAIERLFIDLLFNDTCPIESDWCNTETEAENKGNWSYEFRDYGKFIWISGIVIEEFEVDSDEEFVSGSNFNWDSKTIQKDIVPVIKEWLIRKGYLESPTDDD